MYKLIDGKVISKQIKDELKEKVAGLKAGELVHVIADAHIYDRHVPAIEEIIANPPKAAPKFVIDPTVDDFYKFTRDSFKVEGYEYSEFKSKIPVAV